MPRAMNVGADSSASSIVASADMEYVSAPASYATSPAAAWLSSHSRVRRGLHPARSASNVGGERTRLGEDPVVAELVTQPDREADRRSRHMASQLTDHLLHTRFIDRHRVPP